MPRIMLIDDDRNVLRSLGRIIHFMPVATLRGEAIVESFEKPGSALGRAAEVEFDLVIADYLMPAMNGVSFLRQFMEIQPLTPRMLMSGYTEILEAMDALKDVAPLELITKPWDNNALMAAIAKALPTQRRSQRPLPPILQLQQRMIASVPA